MTKDTRFLKKMSHRAEEVNGTRELSYFLGEFPLNEHLGKNISLDFSGRIQCVNCAREIKKTFGDGYCYPCFIKLAACDMCILKPELCHYRHGTCREPKWGEENCLIPHVVYLANTTGLKVGITREYKKLERWGDQGATEAVVLARVPERYVAGLVEIELKEHLKDRSDWRALIRGQEQLVDLTAERVRIAALLKTEYASHIVTGGEHDKIFYFKYPVLKYPEKALTHSAEKTPHIEGTFEGVRGQYLFIAGKALNVRKYSGYEMTIEVS